MEGLQSIHITGKDIEFSLIEDQTIDIEHILQLNGSSSTADHTAKINQLIEAVKHLNKEIQSIKEK